MDQNKEYLRIRNALNPHRDSRPPYQNEMVQWNDGYDKGYTQAEKELSKKIEELKAKLQKEINARSQIPQDKKDL